MDETLKVYSQEHLEPIPTVTVTFVKATFVKATFVQVTFVQATFVLAKFFLATFGYIRSISAVTDKIWTKL